MEEKRRSKSKKDISISFRIGRKRITIKKAGLQAGAVILALILAMSLIFHGRTVMGNRYGIQDIIPDWSCLNTENVLYSYEDRAQNIAGKAGVDVSAHQGDIDWEQLAHAGVEFAMIRVGYRGYESGALVSDELFMQNIKGARAQGIQTGVYFFSQALTEEEAEEEADFVMELIKDQVITLPVAYDLEHYADAPARTDALTGNQATLNAVAFCEKIRANGYEPMVYLNQHWSESMYEMTQLEPYLLWYADYKDRPALSEEFAMWQYTDSGILPGISSNYIDLNLVFCAD